MGSRARPLAGTRPPQDHRKRGKNSGVIGGRQRGGSAAAGPGALGRQTGGGDESVYFKPAFGWRPGTRRLGVFSPRSPFFAQLGQREGGDVLGASRGDPAALGLFVFGWFFLFCFFFPPMGVQITMFSACCVRNSGLKDVFGRLGDFCFLAGTSGSHIHFLVSFPPPQSPAGGFAEGWATLTRAPAVCAGL